MSDLRRLFRLSAIDPKQLAYLKAEPVARALLVTVLAATSTGLNACGGPGDAPQGRATQGVSGPATSRPPESPIPVYKVVTTEDVSFGAVRRLQVRVSLPDHYPQAIVERIARAVVAELTRAQPVNAIGILFYGPGTSTEGMYDVARVEWAPKGQWGQASSVRAGNYSNFNYSVSYNAPRTQAPRSRSTLKLSKKTGLLGVVLPEGAKLLERIPGDPASDRDPSESYAIEASAAEIDTFFDKSLIAAGWQRDGASKENALFFRKGKLMIAVLGNKKGRTFTLVGS